MRRLRTAKKLGTRHDMNYFKKWSGFRRWRSLLGLAAVVGAVAWLSVLFFRNDKVVYSSGPMSSSHSVFAQQCEACHQPVVKGIRMAGFRKNVTDDACLSCHVAPMHQSNQKFTPGCASCHLEHVGSQHMAQVKDNNCSQCHSNLKTTTGAAMVETAIEDFSNHHPEFKPLRPPARDPGTIGFNHAVHMKKDMLGPDSKSHVQLLCTDCHRAAEDVQAAWKYGEAKFQKVSATTDTAGTVTAGAAVGLEDISQHARSKRSVMAPITFARTCAACHSLQFDRSMGDQVPHDKPEVVRAFMEQKLKDYLANNLNAWREPVASASRKIPGEPIQEKVAKSAAEWVQFRMADDEKLMWGKTCRQCHSMEYPYGQLPVVKDSKITKRWLPRAIFQHEAHALITCVSCHTQAKTSIATADVMLPSIKICQQCHSGDATKDGHAENGCFLCHQYHDWKMAKGFEYKSTFSIPELLGKGSD